MTFTTSKFSVGQIVQHRMFGYRGVTFDVDPCFHGPDEDWYRNLAGPPPPKDKPWYRLLVDGATGSAYVPERDLELDASDEEIDHPLLDRLFQGLADGCYVARRRLGQDYPSVN